MFALYSSIQLFCSDKLYCSSNQMPREFLYVRIKMDVANTQAWLLPNTIANWYEIINGQGESEAN